MDLPKKKISKKKTKKLREIKNGTALIEAREGREGREMTLGGRSPSSLSLMEMYSKDLGPKKKSTKRKVKKNSKLNASLSQKVIRRKSREKTLDASIDK